jgi:hypothetical protein
MRSIRTFVSLFALLLSSSWAFAQPVSFLIDDFNNGNGTAADPLLDGNGAWTGIGPGIPGVVGGNRVIGNYLTEVGVGTSFSNSTVISDGVFSIQNPFNTRSSGEVIWQGNKTTPGTNPIISHPADFTTPLNLNMNTIVSSPNFFFQWSVLNADSRNWTYTVRAYTTSSANYFEGTLTSNVSGDLLSIDRSSFVVGAGTPDWSNIDAISFSANYVGGLLGGDLAIDFFQIAVPEMSTYLMIGLSGLLVGSVYAYRRGTKGEVKPETKPEEAAAVEEQPALQPLLA